jgi:hypothetical protein
MNINGVNGQSGHCSGACRGFRAIALTRRECTACRARCRITKKRSHYSWTHSTSVFVVERTSRISETVSR